MQFSHTTPADGLGHALALAEAEVLDQYGVSVSVRSKGKSLRKFGHRDDLGTSLAEIAHLPALFETMVSANSIDTVSSASGSDTNAVRIEGHTISGSDLTFVVQDATLAGQAKVVLSTPLARMSRMYTLGAVETVGVVYGFEDDTVTAGVPDTDSKVHLTMEPGDQQSDKAATSLSSTDYWFITGGAAAVLKKTGATVDLLLQVRQAGGVWRKGAEISVASTATSTVTYQFDPVIIVPPNADIRVVGVSSAVATAVTVSLSGYLAAVI